MTGYNDIRTALGSAIQAYQPDLNVFYYVPRSLVPPAAIVQPLPHRTVEYLQAQSSYLARWNFNVMLVIGLVDEQAAQDQAGDLISPGSPLITALNNTPLDNGYVVVTEGSVSEMTVSNGLYTYAHLQVAVCA